MSLLLLAALAGASSAPQDPAPPVPSGRWRAELDTPGGPLPFELEFEPGDDELACFLRNGTERQRVPGVRLRAHALVLDIGHYASRIQAELSEDGARLEGEWRKVGAAGRVTRLAFRAEAGDAPRFPRELQDPAAPGPDVSGRWSVRFSGSEAPAVGVFEVDADGVARGTFLTTLGDYRYLAGDASGGHLRLSCFDGAHAFLLDAHVSPGGVMRGDFWSGDSWHETWSAERDAEASLPDPFGLAAWKDGARLDDLRFRDARSLEEVALGDAGLAGRVRLIQLFGSWCPNCHDEAPFLAELWRAYHERGLQVVGIAFEHGDTTKSAAVQVQRFRQRHELPYPLLLGGASDKAAAAEALAGLDRVVAFPTVLFVDAAGVVRRVHSGFSGPATGSAHERERERFHELVRELLAEADAADEDARTPR